MNFAELEPALVEHVRATPVAQRLRVVDALPELDMATLVKKFGQDAPAVYVSAGSLQRTNLHEAKLTAGLMLVAQNASTYAGPRRNDARQGENKGEAGLIGLYEILGHLVPQMHLAEIGGVDWQVIDGGALLQFDDLWKAGLFATVLNIESAPVAINSPIDESSLDDFLLLGANWDLGPTPDGQIEARDDIELPGATPDE